MSKILEIYLSTWLMEFFLFFGNKMCLYFKFSEAEHGYASTLPMPDDYNAKKRSKSKKSQGNRYGGNVNSSVF